MRVEFSYMNHQAKRLPDLDMLTKALIALASQFIISNTLVEENLLLRKKVNNLQVQLAEKSFPFTHLLALNFCSFHIIFGNYQKV